MEQHEKKPSLFMGALAGYAIIGAIGVLVTVIVSINAGRASAVGGLEVILSAGVAGAYLGYLRTVRRRKALGIAEPVDELSKFMGSGKFALLALIVISTSFGLAVLIKVVFDSLKP